jgi:hypothetical protein
MPKLDGTHIHERLRQRLEQLKNGEEVARRELETLLTTQQIEAWDAAWNEQKQLRKAKRARTKEEEAALGWKSKREITIEVIEAALNQAYDGLLDEFDRLLYKQEVRAAKIFMESYSNAIKEGREKHSAWLLANNDLTRAGLRRADGKDRMPAGLSDRDKEIWHLEESIKKRLIAEMTEEERREWEEQMDLLADIEARSKAYWKKE